MIEPTSDQKLRLEALRAALPPIVGDFTASFTSGVCLDLEWHSPKCGCGRALPEDALELVGIGNRERVVQFDWVEREAEREAFSAWLLAQFRAVPVVIHMAAADIKILRKHGFALTAESFAQLDDSVLAHAVLESELPHDLEFLTAEHGCFPQHKDLMRVAPDVYNAADVVETLVIWQDTIEAGLKADLGACRIYRELNMQFLWIAIEGDEAGIAVYRPLPPLLFEKYDTKRAQARRLLQAYVGRAVNIASPDQMKHLLYNVEGLPPQFEKGGAWLPDDQRKVTANKDAIAALRRHCKTEWDPDVQPTLAQAMANIEAGGNPILEARYLFTGAQQAVSHYIQPLLDDDGQALDRIFPECRIHVQASGRIGWVRPALPQMKDELLDQLMPDSGAVWLGHDWSQIEVRLLAVLANDEVYLDAFANGVDIHEQNVRTIFPVKGSPELEALRRRWIKAFVFRLYYRGKPQNAGDIPGTRALFGTDTAPLVVASAKHLEAHPAIPPYWSRVEAEAASGVVRTFMGRPRRLHGSGNAAKREASNHPMQGGVSDVFVTTALLVKRAAPWARLVFGAYDSMFWSVPLERETEFLAMYAPIVEREFVINGHKVRFPASFKRRSAPAGLGVSSSLILPE